MNWHGRGTLATLLVLTAAAGACVGDRLVAPIHGPVALVVFSINASGGVSALVIEVSGPGIDSPLVYNVTLDAGTASGAVRVPAGGGRHFSARAFDVVGVMTHRGDTMLTLVEGTNPQVALLLRPLVGSVPIVLTFGGAGLTVTPGDTTVQVGQTVQFAGGGVDSLGGAISPASVLWSSTDQSVVLVDASGLARARASGSAYVLASFQGAARGRKVTVAP